MLRFELLGVMSQHHVNLTSIKRAKLKLKFNNYVLINFCFKFGTVKHVTAGLLQSETDTETSLTNYSVTTVSGHALNFRVTSFLRRLQWM